MGKVESKEKAKNQIIENSTGTHLFELHIPTMGFGLCMIVTIVIIIGIILWIVRKKRRFDGQMMLPSPHQMVPAHPMLLSQLMNNLYQPNNKRLQYQRNDRNDQRFFEIYEEDQKNENRKNERRNERECGIP
jgi:hypothetical protein